MHVGIWLVIELALVAFFVFGYILWRRRRRRTAE
jgi:hypothetical protein